MANNGLNATEWLGLSWTDIGFSKPRGGTALNMTKYADFGKTLQIRTTFTREQIDSFNLESLSYKSYIQVGEGLTAKYFRPTAAEKDDTVAVLFHDGQKWAIAKITELTPTLGKAPDETAFTDFFRNFHAYAFTLEHVPLFSTPAQVLCCVFECERHDLRTFGWRPNLPMRSNAKCISGLSDSNPTQSASPEDAEIWRRNGMVIKLQMTVRGERCFLAKHCRQREHSWLVGVTGVVRG